MKGLLLAIYNYRGFIVASVKRDFQSRYQTSMLGAAWLILQPLAMILVYTLVFSQVMKARLPGETGPYAYSIYLCAGVLTWGLFAEIIGRSKGVFIDNANLLKKMSFPKICLPVIVVISSTINFFIIFSLFIIFLLSIGQFPGSLIFDFLIVLTLQIILASGIGIIVGILNVFFRDVGQFVDVCLQFLFWSTPIVYAIDIISDELHSAIMLNPMARLVSSYQEIFVHKQSPDWQLLFPVLIFAIFCCLVGLTLFRKHSSDMVDEL
ncbi:ABC transporter permease [Vibrio sp. 10N.222.54.F12]|uniref:ABC transporter permease n=1 Tax=Vibrio TaxID=662 RepID=UPI0002D4156E|nr:ABC transporter permease [Vibrio tasmaniensis]OEF64853.1 ABC transporter [Vibrio tasmaniensis 1F-187]PML18558.1 ABC transporter [Vibrio tasmaniensis]PML49387.1 ABC transporter [Vibrio tasmaniensis]